MSTLKKKMFDIVQFVQRDDSEKKSIDCVPSSWIIFDQKSHQLMTKFMPPPYTASRCFALHKMVKENKNAPDNWPNYAINIVQSVGTYSEAELKIERLKHEEYIYTTDTDEIEQENIENINNQNTNKHEDLPIRDMKGKLSKRKSSSNSSIESMTDRVSENETNKKKHKKCKVMPKKKISNEKSQEKLIVEKHIEHNKKFIFDDDKSPHIIMKYLRHILFEIKGIKHDQQMIQYKIQKLNDKFERVMQQRTEVIDMHWTEENNIEWPLKNKTQFDKFNNLLEIKKIRNDFMENIAFIIDTRTVLSKNLLAIIRKFIHRDLATKMTCTKQMNDKFTLKPSLFYKCIIDTFKAKFSSGAFQENVSEKILDKLIGTILTNSKDWEKGRVKKILLEAKEKEDDKEDEDYEEYENDEENI